MATMVPGIDISNQNGHVNLPVVARCGWVFVIAKATEGVGYTDQYFKENWQAAGDLGLVRGAYCFGRPDLGPGRDEADFFLNTVKDIRSGDFFAFDVEQDKGIDPSADLLAYTLDFFHHADAGWGAPGLFYSRHGYMAPHNLEGNPELAQHGLWLASYQSNLPPIPKPWPWFAIWQYAGGVVPGVTGACDLDLYNGDRTSLLKYGKP